MSNHIAIRFPGIGAINEVHIFPEPDKQSDEETKRKYELVKARVKLVGRAQFVDWQRRMAKIQADENARQYKRYAGMSEDEVSADKERDPLGGVSPEFEQAVSGLQEEVIMQSCVGLRGVAAGDQEMTDCQGQELIDVITHLGLFGLVGAACLRAQQPSVEQVK